MLLLLSPPALATISPRLYNANTSQTNAYSRAAPVISASLFIYISTVQSSTRRVTECQAASFGGQCAGIWAKSVIYRSQVVGRCPAAAEDGKEVDLNGDERKFSVDAETSNENRTLKENFSSKELMEQLKRYGVAGVLSYGLLNTAYYLVTFLSVWFYFAPAPGKLGYTASVKRFVKIMAAVWAGSQVTKLLRAAGALALAPVVEKGLSWFTVKFRFDSKAKAFAAIAGMCFGLAFLLFVLLTFLWA